MAKTIGLMIGNVKKERNLDLDLLDLLLGLDLTQWILNYEFRNQVPSK